MVDQTPLPGSGRGRRAPSRPCETASAAPATVPTDQASRHRYPGEASPPDLILLDLKLPKKDGREVLAEIKADPALRKIPVVVLTSSPAEQDIVEEYDHHANCYVRKPTDLEQFHTMIQQIEAFWITVVKLPPKR